MLKTLRFLSLFVSLMLAPLCAKAHVPFVELKDYTIEAPFVIPVPINRSIAVYAWLPEGDVDYFTLHLSGSERVFVSSLVPRCTPYALRYPWFAVAGANLPEDNLADFAASYDSFPLELFSEPRVWVVPNYDYTASPRDEIFEFFAHKYYYGGPDFDQVLPAGDYRLFFWEATGQPVDYVAEIGKLELWTIRDIFPTFFVTLPWLIGNGEIHDPCCHPRLR